MTIGNGAITGTLYRNEGWSSGYLKGPGYYLALKFTSNDWSQYDSVKVGLDPSAQSGIVEILNDPDKNGVFKVKQNLSQKFVVEYRKGEAVERDVYDLSGLTLSEEPPTPPADPGPLTAPASGVFFDAWQINRSLSGQNISMGQYTDESTGGNVISRYSGITGTITDANGYVGFRYSGDTVPANATNAIVKANDNVIATVPAIINGKINFAILLSSLSSSTNDLTIEIYSGEEKTATVEVILEDVSIQA